MLDQRVKIPILVRRTVIDRSQREPPLFQFGYDDEDRGGFFVQHPFPVVTTDRVQFTVSPQIYIQRAIFDTKTPFNADNFGVYARLRYLIGPQTVLRGRVSLTSFDFDNVANNLRASLRLTQYFGLNTLVVEYSFRDRLFNGSLGFQTVQSSIGAVFSSSNFELGRSGITLRYQGFSVR